MWTRRLAVMVAIVLMSGAAALAGDQFQGKWKVTVTPDDDAKAAGVSEFEDTLVFKGNTFVAEACVPYGFDSVEYESDTRGLTAASFTAEPKSESSGTAKWSGFTTGQEIQGELVWTKTDGTVVRYTFKGARQE